MSVILVLIGVVLFILAVIAFFKPLPKLKLGSKKAAGVAMLLSLGSCVVGGALAPDTGGQIGSTDLDASTTSDGSPQTTAALDGVAIGTPIRSRGAEVTIRSVKQRNQVGIQYLEERVSQGGTLIVVDYDVTNIGNEPLSFFAPKIDLVDANGVRYSADIAKSAAYATENEDNSKVFSALNPGITTQGSTVFEVAASRFDPATWYLTVEGRKNKVLLQ